MDQTTYCPQCGRAMEQTEVAGRTRHICPGCNFVLYQNPVPGAGVLIEMDDGLVLIRRGEEPFLGWWALPAGYIEADESVEQAAVRECREETGLEIELVELFGVYSFPEGSGQSGLIIFYRGRPVGGELCAGDDAQDVGVFAPDGLPERLAFRTHREVIARWRRTRWPAADDQVPAVTIRPGRRADSERILELARLLPGNADATPAEQSAASQRLRECLAMEMLVAEVDAKVVGFLTLTFTPGLTRMRALLGEMAVDPAHRRQGIGGALVEAAIRRSNERGATHLLVDTSRVDVAAQEFYQACGFELGGVAPLHIR